MIEESVPNGAASAWQPVTTQRLYAADCCWIVAFALQRRATGWYVRLVRYPEPNPTARHLTEAGPYPDPARAGAGAAALVHLMLVALDQPVGN